MLFQFLALRLETYVSSRNLYPTSELRAKTEETFFHGVARWVDNVDGSCAVTMQFERPEIGGLWRDKAVRRVLRGKH